MLPSTSDEALSDRRLMEKIDRLFELNVGEYVDLPQLLVVGDQSSGKSSVLEGLTGLPFPRSSGLCTRFATQITFRRSTDETTTVSIIPAADSSDERAANLRAWVWDEQKVLDRGTFADVLSSAATEMGLSASRDDPGSKTFSDDVLRIEICGPEQQHLSVVDVPGIFKRTTAGLTTKDDIELVRRMVLSYMSNPRAVILAVIPANVDIATQEILELAEGIDTDGRRTLGVLTKPDLVDKGAEKDVLDLIDGKKHCLALGWYLVKNPGQQELDSQDPAGRSSAETHFLTTKEPWTRCPRDRVGSKSLRARLVELLSEMIETEFGKVKNEISARLKEKRKEIELLGPARDTRERQHHYLLDLAGSFQSLTLNALKANYACDEILATHTDLKIATAMVNRHELFSWDFKHFGHLVEFHLEDLGDERGELGHDEQVQIKGTKSKYYAPSTLLSGTSKGAAPETEDQKYTMCTRTESVSDPDLDGVLLDATQVITPFRLTDLGWLEQIYKNSRGWDVGALDSSMIQAAWRRQSCKWKEITLGYICDLIQIVHRYIIRLISGLCHDQTVQRRLLTFILDPLLNGYKRSIAHTEFCLKIESSTPQFTANHYFANELQKCQQKRIQVKLEEKALNSYHFEGRVQKQFQGIRVSDAAEITHKSNMEQNVESLNDTLQAYYKVARKRFVDTVCKQAGDYFLLFAPDSPLNIFTPSFVSRLSEDELESIAGEDRVTKRKRQQLRRDIENLEAGRKVLV